MKHIRLVHLGVFTCLLSLASSFRLTSRQSELTESSLIGPRAGFVPAGGSMSLAPHGLSSHSQNGLHTPISRPHLPQNPARARSNWQNPGQLTMSAQPATDKYAQLPREDWPGGMASYRFISDDPMLKAYASTVPFNMPDKYQGTRRPGTYKESFRVMFSNKDHNPKTIELLKSNSDDNPSFGAVEVKLPLDIRVARSSLAGKLAFIPMHTHTTDNDDGQIPPVTVDDLESRKRLVVTDVPEGNAELSGIRNGDIIRAVSVPEPDGAEKPWYGKLDVLGILNRGEVPAAQEGMVMLEGTGVPAFNAMLLENWRQRQETVTLVIERPFNVRSEQGPDKSRGGGIAAWASPMGA